MFIDKKAILDRIKKFDLSGLFTQELGWDWHTANLEIQLDGKTIKLTALAQKRGMVAYQCATSAGGSLPNYAVRRKIEQQVAKAAHEHIIIFTDAAQTTQIWQWVKREPGKPSACREHHFHKSQSGEALLQKLQPIAFTLDEEETLVLTDVTSRTRAGFDLDRVTKKFYEQFKKEHAAFLDLIGGFPAPTKVDGKKKFDPDHEWYASVMLNRLMFVYFIQRKGFLDGDHDYLRNRLKRCQQEQGKDKFYPFYRYFLLRLFHEGFGRRRKDRAADLEKLLGNIPYLNGGLFDVHEIEKPERYGKDIQIPDKAFERIFDYFDQYQWHLDERPLRDDNEINPDVLGYIFEKYINQKQMGAYYTKEDITEYISKNTVLPLIFDAVRAKCKDAFENPGGPTIWDLVREDPDRYVYAAVKKGVELPLPKIIEAGIKDVSKRGGWNKPAHSEFALPTEIWREVVARRQRYWEVWSRLSGRQFKPEWVANPPTQDELRSPPLIIHNSSFIINDFVTLNLDLRQFTQDVIQNCERPELLMAFWQAISSVTVLDITGGSGAFIFAALNILEPLYEACLDRMEAFLAEWGENGKKAHPYYHKQFTEILARVDAHPNRRYFVLKSIILNNLYAVDIMEEAVEICKLRLFLKLAAQVEPNPDDPNKNLGIEPLPDIDFNIRAGNSLVGYATRAELEAVGNSDWILKEQVREVIEAAEDAAKLYECFLKCQVEGDQSPADFKAKLRLKFDHAREKCDRFLAESYELASISTVLESANTFGLWGGRFKRSG